MSEQPGGRMTVWAQAMRFLRGGDTAALLERFTREATMVAEGLCEDQARLRQAVDSLSARSQEEQAHIAETLRAMDARLTELSVRVAELERKRSKRRATSWKGLGRAGRFAAMLCGTALLVAVLRLLG